MPLFSRLTNGFNSNSRATNANANANALGPTPATNYAPTDADVKVEYTFQAIGDGYVHEDVEEETGEVVEEYYYEEKPEAEEVDIPTGTYLEVKRLDELYDLEIRDWILQDSTVPEPKYKKEKDEYKHYAFTVVRKFEKRSDPADFLYQTLLDIKSPHLKKACEEVIGSVRGISWTFTPLRLNPQIILTFLPDFDEYAAKLREKEPKTEDDELMSSHLDFFLDYIRLDNAKNLETINNLLAHGEITFDLLWVILVPRTTIYTRCIVTDEPRAFTMTHAERGTSNGISCWDIEGEYVEYNAKCHAEKATPGTPKFGLATFKPVQIMIFEGAVKISSLPHYPIKFHPHADDLQTLLVERGKRWCSTQGAQHRHFKGMGFNRYTGKYSVDSRIMIDWKTFIDINPNYNLPNVIKTLDGVDIEKHKTSYGKVDELDDPSVTVVSDKHLLLTSPIVYGFSLADKLWLEFNIENVSTFEWSSEPFENLVLPPAQKKLIRSLVETHNKDSTGFDDFVKGKGRGLIINLFGNPGVGKSLTAEATSEHVKKPLYIVGAGDLGITASELDSNLTQIFSISSSWGAVVLIDEADVFLEERSVHDLQRNAVVAVFLRQLEYFRGILFMTTNRVKSFDEAFQSRIHISLRYHDLKPDARRKIWIAFLKKVKGQDTLGVSDEELKDLSERAVNGRQIKNIVKTASALAAADDEPLGYSHLALVLDMIDQFEVDKREMP